MNKKNINSLWKADLNKKKWKSTNQKDYRNF